MLKKNKGLTLVETMVVMGISTFIVVAMYGALTTARRSWLTGEALLDVQQGARLGLDNMLRELRQAATATVSGAGNTIVSFSIPIDANGDGFIDIFPPGTNNIVYGADDAADFDGDGVFWESGWTIQYQINPLTNQIMRSVLDNATPPAVVSARVVAREINANPALALTFFQARVAGAWGSGTTDEAVLISLTTQKGNVQGVNITPPVATTLVTRVNLRN